MVDSKRCNKCGEVKVAAEFHKRESSKDGLRGQCKCCLLLNKKAYYIKNSEIIKYKKRIYNKINKEKIAIKDKIRRIKNYEKNKEKIAAKNKERYLKNKERHYKKSYEYTKRRKKEDAIFKLKHDVRSFIACSFYRKTVTKNNKTEIILGCSFEDFKKHLEAQFKPGMTWENRSKWHIDHIIPLASAKTEEDVIKLCHYTNLQPLWAHENLAKGAKITS